MRYLKLYALDANDNDVSDIVFLDFHDDSRGKTLVRRAAAFDVSESGELDWVVAGDVNNDGVETYIDELMSIQFAQTFLEFKWVSVNRPFDSYLKVYAEKAESPAIRGAVHLEFYRSNGATKDAELVYTLTHHAGGDGQVPRIDANGDKIIDAIDAVLLEKFTLMYAGFDWV
ncbi:hypothetical protein C4K00_1558 [Pseudomonas synxantha]|uniref:hypothetical protein n=1 Tax=Pseudomonas synxantha TaxID=47883 RepID=UPI000F563840|nr:hypothetical protein [Pseudomonas synxantha]AZE71801.1 hypothetical protein C4K00_1558 [Pseudomonas synxantha]AZE77463.1 hypothetical protein C4J99_1664 [Pseudomonas synxantha]